MHASERGGGNLPFVAQEVPGQPVVIVGLCNWQQGLLLAPGNPKAIRHASDLARPDIRVVNRELGAGSRLLFDLWLASDGIVGSQLAGYHRELPSHIAIGEAIAAGAADAGPGILSVARALDLEFLALQEEPYDLVVPLASMRSAPMQAMLEVAVSGPYRRELAALGGYDTHRSGTVVAQLGA
jgi:putative molybdopterin biosynthesis protein